MVIREYDDTGRLISKLGGDQIDFIHQKDGNVKVVNNVTHQTNIIKEGSKYIKGYTHRGNDVSWIDITKEFLSGNGPEKSLFSDFSEQGKGVFESLKEVCAENQIRYQIRVAPRGGNDAGAVHQSKTGIPTCGLSIPTRNIHSNVEIVHIDDLENAFHLVYRVAQEGLKEITL